MRLILVVLILQIFLLGGCTWVKLTEGGATVRQATEADIANCQKVGVVSAHTKDQVVVNRSDNKVREELLVLARNEAARLDGDTIVAMAPPREGQQDFTAYKCR
ncbi:MAG: DUF4156 domain-containing protein [Gammaproteobacteria bacterium]|nr:DUF4156 domain-containing protein [Gammaproteobacteria bacterium]